MVEFQKMLKEMAKQNGTTPEHMLEEMQRAIDHAYAQYGDKPGSPWEGIAFKGDRPTPEELITQLALRVQGGKGARW